MDEAKFRKWMRWLKVIDDEVTSVFLYRDVWRHFASVLDANTALQPSIFFRVLALSYAASQAVAVRRIAEEGTPRRPVVSLGCLIADVRDNAELVGPSLWVKVEDTQLERIFVTASWRRTFGAAVDEHLDPNVASADLVQLADAVAPITKYVDQYLAHRDPGPPLKTPPKFEDLHAAIEVIGELFWKYNLLLTGSDRHPISPILPPGWQHVFEVPWKESDGNTPT